MNHLRTFNNNHSDVVHRIAPFALFMSYIGIEEILRFAVSHKIFEIPYSWFLYLYPLKTITVGFFLFRYRKSYIELAWSDLANLKALLTAITTGIIVFILWINMTWSWAVIGTPNGFDPTVVTEKFIQLMLIFFRLIGAAIIVPIMEELFWRSWLLRYLISSDFQSVPVGKLTFTSYIIGTIMFGLEHNLWLAGIMAGSAYALIWYQSKSLVQCIVAHAITNLLLGIYVLQTGRWEFW